MALDKTINKLRTEAKLSQEQFAELVGVSYQAVQKWESGASMPSIDKLIKISKSLSGNNSESNSEKGKRKPNNREIKSTNGSNCKN